VRIGDVQDPLEQPGYPLKAGHFMMSVT
jgi:hypothetical protein